MKKKFTVWLVLLLSLFVKLIYAQDEHDNLQHPAKVPAAASRLPADEFVMPDIPDSWLNWTHYESDEYTIKFGLAPIVDYTTFNQNQDSLDQVGKQEGEWDLRSGRFSVGGFLKFRNPWQYFLTLEYNGFDRDPDESSFGVTDVYIGIPLGGFGTMKVGKIKEPFIYEIVGDAANLQQYERILSPFFVSRNIGIRVGNTFLNDRMSWSAGWFNDWWVEDQDYDESGNQFAGRLTGLPYSSEDGSKYVHLAVAARYNGAESGAVRFKGRPESNVTDIYADTGNIIADNSKAIDFEFLWGNGQFFITSEYVNAWVDSPETGDPQFWGFYVTGSWCITGEHRPYDRKVAYARRIFPRSRWGAWEISARYSHLDLDDKDVNGGKLDKYMAGLSWWATNRWRIGFAYGFGNLDRFGLDGTTQSYQLRFQWIH